MPQANEADALAQRPMLFASTGFEIRRWKRWTEERKVTDIYGNDGPGGHRAWTIVRCTMVI